MWYVYFLELGCRLIKPEPQSDCGEFCEGQIGLGFSVVACGDVSELLEFVDAALDEIALFVFALAERDFFAPV